MNLQEATIYNLAEGYDNYAIDDFQNFSIAEIDNYANDLEILELGTELIRKAKDRLDKDLDNSDIKDEYDKLNGIIHQLEDIQNNYV